MIDKDCNINSSIQQLHERGICVIIPTYNNEGTIVDVVRRTQMQCQDVIVVNDGSTDKTSDLLHGLSNITIVEYSENKGKGIALREGFKKAIRMGFSYAITLDSDGQHYPEDIPLFLDGNKRHPGAIIMGQRKLDGVDRSKGSKFANAFSNFWFCVQTLHYIPDTQTGYRLYPLKKLYGLSFLTSRYEAELELIVWASWHGVQIYPIPVNVYYPPRQERVSHFRPGLDFTRISVLNTILSLLAIVYGWPLAILRLGRTVLFTLIALLFFLINSICVVTPFALCYIVIAKIMGLSIGPLHGILHLFGKLVIKLFPIIDVHVKINNQFGEDFKKPAILICNHQSHLDLMLQLCLTKKIVFLTNDWVWNSPFFGFVIRHAKYYPVSAGIDNILPNLKELVDQGYSISIFPEGTRSLDGNIGRFHKGAFHIAEQLGLDIIPLLIYGAHDVLPKKGKYIRRGTMSISIDKRVSNSDQKEICDSLKDRARFFRKYYIGKYQSTSNKSDQYA